MSDPLSPDEIAKSEAAKCRHEHLRFEGFGAALRCIDCKRRWITVKPGYDIADYLYSHPHLSDFETRHSPWVSPRMTPR